jgi:hypothetical protein
MVVMVTHLVRTIQPYPQLVAHRGRLDLRYFANLYSVHTRKRNTRATHGNSETNYSTAL